jgi:hypothetical protein
MAGTKESAVSMLMDGSISVCMVHPSRAHACAGERDWPKYQNKLSSVDLQRVDVSRWCCGPIHSRTMQ